MENQVIIIGKEIKYDYYSKVTAYIIYEKFVILGKVFYKKTIDVVDGQSRWYFSKEFPNAVWEQGKKQFLDKHRISNHIYLSLIKNK